MAVANTTAVVAKETVADANTTDAVVKETLADANATAAVVKVTVEEANATAEVANETAAVVALLPKFMTKQLKLPEKVLFRLFFS